MQALKFEFLKFRILEILDFHPCTDSIALFQLLNDLRQLKNEPVRMDTLDQLTAPKDGKVEAERKKKEVAAKRRAKIMAKMSAMQKNFIKENSELFENTSTELFPRVGSDMDLR